MTCKKDCISIYTWGRIQSERIKDVHWRFAIRKCDILTYLGAESTKEGVPEVAQCERKVFVKKVSEKATHPVIGPPAVHQEQPL